MGYEVSDPKIAAQVIQDLGKQFFNSGFEIRFVPCPFEIRIAYLESGRQIAGFTLIEQPNCCGVLISTKTWVAKSHQGMGIAKGMQPFKEALARQFGYSCLAATVNMTGNPAEVHILTQAGWSERYSFTNRRTGNRVGFFFKDI